MNFAPNKSIPIAMLLTANPLGIRVPFPGKNGGRDHMAHTIAAGDLEGALIEIEFRPWLRHHVVSRSERDLDAERKAGDGEKRWKLTHFFLVHETLVTPSPVQQAE